MKRVLMLVCIVLSMLSANSQDTVVNNGDGKVVIIDKRPITRRVVAPTKSESVVVNVPAPVTNNYYYPEEQPVVYHPNHSDYDLLPWTIFFVIAAFGAYMIFFYKKPCNCHQCSHSHPQPPAIFHVHGGQAIIDGSETWSNLQTETHYHKHHHMPIMGMPGSQRATETATGQENKS